ncbi:glycosyltransferase family 39 protein [Anaerolineales bacterium HSG25]|nr:glycosyltransferase family 39 protein [Anaerolineales bacterium HSG25]
MTDYSILYGVLSFITIFLSSLIITRISKPANFVEAVLLCFTVCTGQILLIGYTLSSVNFLNKLDYWAATSIIVLGVVLVVSSNKLRQQKYKLSVPSLRDLKILSYRLSHLERIVLFLLMSVTVLTSSINLIMIFSSTPYTWDSMTYHLARAAYYIQHGNLDYYDANFWAQVVHPKGATILMIYTFLATGLNENLTRIIQFVAYWVAVLSVYGISHQSNCTRRICLFSALVFALLIESLMQAITTQNDMLLTAYIGTVVYFLFAFKRSQHNKHLFWAGINLGLAISIKASAFLSLPSLFIISWYTLKHQNIQTTRKNVQGFFFSSMLALFIFALPAGYWENYQMFGHPIGPEGVRRLHSFEGVPTSEAILIGTKNVLRFGFDFLSLDGLPQIGPIVKIQEYLRAFPIWITRFLSIDLETSRGVIEPFQYQRVPRAHEDGAFWGILGFGLIWITVFLSVIRVIKEPTYRVLSLAAIMFWITQSYVGPYDPWRGRYFITAAIFATPSVGWLFNPNRNKMIKIYLLGIILIGTLSAFTAVALRPKSMLFTIQYKSEIRQSVFSMDRLTQLTRNKPDSYEILRVYENLVPKTAIVAVYLEPNAYEYPLFGEKLSRTLVPINSFRRGPQPIPEHADYLVFSSKLIEPAGKDICPDSGIYCLRNLKLSKTIK